MPTSMKLIPLISAAVATASVFYIYGIFATRHTMYASFARYLAPYRFLAYK